MKSTILIIFLTLCFNCRRSQAQDIQHIEKADSTICLAHDTIVQVNVEKSARFRNGDLLIFTRYIAMNIRYPIEAISNNYQGKAYIKFVVNWDGQVINVTTYKSSGYKTLDNEAVRVVKNSPPWTSAKDNDICVPQQFVIPVVFRSLGVINR